VLNKTNPGRKQNAPAAPGIAVHIDPGKWWADARDWSGCYLDRLDNSHLPENQKSTGSSNKNRSLNRDRDEYQCVCRRRPPGKRLIKCYMLRFYPILFSPLVNRSGWHRCFGRHLTRRRRPARPDIPARTVYAAETPRHLTRRRQHLPHRWPAESLN
jgi:hypothetical protein